MVRKTNSPVWNFCVEAQIKVGLKPCLVDIVVKSSTELLGVVTLDLDRPVSKDSWHTLGALPGKDPYDIVKVHTSTTSPTTVTTEEAKEKQQATVAVVTGQVLLIVEVP